MRVDNSSSRVVRSARDIMKGLLKKAFRENRGGEVIPEILERRRKIRQFAEEDKAAIREIRLYKDQPRSVKFANFHASQKGSFARVAEAEKSDEIKQQCADVEHAGKCVGIPGKKDFP